MTVCNRRWNRATANADVVQQGGTATTGSTLSSVAPEMAAPASIIRTIFPLQSYLSSTLLQNALAVQDPNDPIVAATKNTRQVKGRLVGLHPASETPITIRLNPRGDSSGVDTITMSPGQVMRVKANGFYGIEWGLPFGWLGGGLAQLVFSDSEDTYVAWPEVRPEVMFHRQRIQIVADANPTTTPAVSAANWPLRLPWTNAFRNAGGTLTSQQGAPLFAIEPTKVLLRLRLNSLAAATPMRMIAQGFDSLDLGTDGATIAFTDFTAEEITWPSAIATAVSTPYPVLDVRTGILLDGGDQAVLTFTDLATSVALTNQYVDVFRYGRL